MISFMPFASYAVDVGKYHVGAKGQVRRSDTTTAWARSDEGTPSFDVIQYYSGSSRSLCTASRFPPQSWLSPEY